MRTSSSHTACSRGLLASFALVALGLVACGGDDPAAEDRPIPASRQDLSETDTFLLASRMQPLAATAAETGRTVYPSDLLDWAEQQFPQLFPSHESNRQTTPFTFRYYPATGNFAGLAGDEVFVLGPVSGGQLQSVGSARSVYCQVYPVECAQAPVSLASEAQVRQLAARTANAIFIYDALSYEIMNGVFNGLWGELGKGLTQAPLATGRMTLPCSSGGSATATVLDVDGSRTLSVGDRITVSASNCVLDKGSGPQFSGELEITLVDGRRMAEFWNQGGYGLIELGLVYRGVRTRFGLLDGSYRYRSSWPDGQPSGEDSSRFDRLLAIGNDNSRVQLTDVLLVFGPPVDDDSSTLTSASGAVATDVAGLGSLRNELSLARPLRVSTATLRSRPQDGVLRLAGKGYRIDLTYGGTRAVTLSLDNGSDGTTERVLATTEDQLDTLLRDF